MNLRDKVSKNIQESRENSGDGDYEELEQIEVDMGEIPFIKASPTTLLTGTFPEDEGNPVIRFWNEQNEGRKDQGYLGLVMDDIRVNTDDDGTESTVVVHDESDSTDYRVFNTDDGKTDLVDGVGIKIEQQGGQALYDGDVLQPDEFEVDRAIVVVSGAASTSVARRLDVKGATEADGGDGEFGTNGGLIEINPTDDGPRTRYARDPELKSSLYGTRVGLMLSRRAEVDDTPTGYVGAENDPAEYDAVLGTGDDGSTHNNAYQASYAELVEAGERRDMYWYSAFDMSGDEPEIVEQTAEEEPIDRPYLEWRERGEADAETGLSDEEQEFVEEYRESEKDTDEETILQNIEAVHESFDDEPDEEAIVEALA